MGYNKRNLQRTSKIIIFLFFIFTIHAEDSFKTIKDENTLLKKNENEKISKIELKNGIFVYLISDPKINNSAAAISINVGYFNDPKKAPGKKAPQLSCFSKIKAFPDFKKAPAFGKQTTLSNNSAVLKQPFQLFCYLAFFTIIYVVFLTFSIFEKKTFCHMLLFLLCASFFPGCRPLPCRYLGPTILLSSCISMM